MIPVKLLNHNHASVESMETLLHVEDFRSLDKKRPHYLRSLVILYVKHLVCPKGKDTKIKVKLSNIILTVS